jgi:hypothetical protein
MHGIRREDVDDLQTTLVDRAGGGPDVVFVLERDQ